MPRTAQEAEHYAVVWAESRAPADATHNIGSITRVGVRIYLDTGPGGEPLSDFKIERLHGTRDKRGRPSVTAAVRNLGRRAVDLSGTLHLRNGPGGISAGPFRVTAGVTLPSYGSGTVTVPLDPGLPDGPWKAQLTLRSGTVVRTATAPVMLSEEGAKSRDDLYAGVIGAAGLAAAVLALVCLRRRRRAGC